MAQKTSALQNSATNTASSENQAQTSLLNQADNEYSQFMGSNQTNSPFYKSLVTSGTDATTSAYQNAKSNMAAQSNAAGFGYASPASAGGNAQVGQQEAKAVGQIPLQATQTAAQMGMQAAQGIQGSAGQEGQQALGYEDAATSMQNTKEQDNSSMLNALMGSAAKAGGSFLQFG